MLQFELTDRIETFVKTFGLVQTNQVYRFFRDEPKNAISRVLTSLLNDRFIFAPVENYLSSREVIPNPIINYSDRIKAIYVMCALKSEDIKWFTVDEFPLEILFVNNDGVCYAVSVFNDRTWSTKYALFKKLRSRPLIKDVPDPINYIAVVPNEDLIPKIRDLNFAYYALLDNNGKPTLLRDEDSND